MNCWCSHHTLNNLCFWETADRKSTFSFYRRPLSGLENSKVGCKSKLVVSVHLWHVLPDHFNSLSAKHLIYKETLSKSSSLFWRSHSTQTFNKVKLMALSQVVVYSGLSISNLFELLETVWINSWPLLFATEIRLHSWQHSWDEPRSVFSCAHRALPVLWLTPEAPGPSVLHVWSMCSPWTAVLYFAMCCWSTWLHSPTKLCEYPSKNSTFFLKTQQYCTIFSHKHWGDTYLVIHWAKCPRPSQILGLPSHHNFVNPSDSHYLYFIFLL